MAIDKTPIILHLPYDSKYHLALREGTMVGMDPVGTIYGMFTRNRTIGYDALKGILDLTPEQITQRQSISALEGLVKAGGVVVGLAFNLATFIAPCTGGMLGLSMEYKKAHPREQ